MKEDQSLFKMAGEKKTTQKKLKYEERKKREKEVLAEKINE